MDRTGSRVFPLVRHHHRQVALQRPLRPDSLMVRAFAVARFHLYTGQAHGLEHVHRHGLALRRAFPFALHHRDGIRQTDKSWMLQRWNSLVPKKQHTDEPIEKQIEAVLSASTPPATMKQEDEIKHYDSLVSKVQPEQIRILPESLQTNDALFLLVLFREDGYLDTDFLPLMKRRMTKSIRHSTPISPVPFAPPSKSGKANGSSSRSSGRSTTAHSWQATSRPPTGTTRPNTSGISPSCCARQHVCVRSSTPTTLKSSRRYKRHYSQNIFPCSRHRNPMAGFLCPSEQACFFPHL